MIDQAKNLRKLVRDSEKGSLGTHVQPTQHTHKTGIVKKCKSIAITSGKGGVGKSITAISLAIALARLKKNVLIFDGDLGLANIHILLGISPKSNLAHVVMGECSLFETLCAGPEGITIIPGASGIASMANIESINLEKLIRDLSKLEQEYDFLIIDGGAGISPAAMQLNCMADLVLLVLTPEPTSLADAYSTIKILLSKGMDSIDVLVNMATSEGDGEEILKKLHSLTKYFLDKEVNKAGIIPYVKNMTSFIRAQKNIISERPNSVFSTRIFNIARKMCGLNSMESESFFSRFLSSHLEKNES